MYVIGIMGFFMRRFEFPIAPVILGVILGPVMEIQFRRALTASGGDWGVFVERPLTVGLLATLMALIVGCTTRTEPISQAGLPMVTNTPVAAPQQVDQTLRVTPAMEACDARPCGLSKEAQTHRQAGARFRDTVH